MGEHSKLEGEEIVIHVPKGTGKNVRIEETEVDQPSHITVRVSRNRKSSALPVLGVIVK